MVIVTDIFVNPLHMSTWLVYWWLSTRLCYRGGGGNTALKKNTAPKKVTTVLSQWYIHISTMAKAWASRYQVFSYLVEAEWRIYVTNLAIIGSENGLSPGWHQAIIRTNAGILLIAPLGANFSETLIGIQTFSWKKIHLNMSSAKMAAILSRPQCVKNTLRPWGACVSVVGHQWFRWWLITCLLSLPEPMLTYCQLDPYE